MTSARHSQERDRSSLPRSLVCHKHVVTGVETPAIFRAGGAQARSLRRTSINWTGQAEPTGCRVNTCVMALQMDTGVSSSHAMGVSLEFMQKSCWCLEWQGSHVSHAPSAATLRTHLLHSEGPLRSISHFMKGDLPHHHCSQLTTQSIQLVTSTLWRVRLSAHFMHAKESLGSAA